MRNEKKNLQFQYISHFYKLRVTLGMTTFKHQQRKVCHICDKLMIIRMQCNWTNSQTSMKHFDYCLIPSKWFVNFHILHISAMNLFFTVMNFNLFFDLTTNILVKNQTVREVIIFVKNDFWRLGKKSSEQKMSSLLKKSCFIDFSSASQVKNESSFPH